MKPASSLNQLPLSSTERILKITAIAALVIHLVIVAINYAQLPDRIPVHFGINGKPDGWGEKWTLLLLVGTTIGLFFLMHFITTIGADKYNYPVTITPQNQAKQYQLSRQLMFMMNAGIMVLFLLISWVIIQTAKGSMNGLGLWFWIALLVLVFVPIGYTLLASRQYK